MKKFLIIFALLCVLLVLGCLLFFGQDIPNFPFFPKESTKATASISSTSGSDSSSPQNCTHTYGKWAVTSAPTCIESGERERICGKCGRKEKESLPKTDHTFVTDPAVPATCTQTGKTEGAHCTVCQKVLVEQKTIPATKHVSVTDAAVPATCTKTGRSSGSHCRVCGKILKAQEDTKALGHSYWAEITKKPTCEKEGVKTFTCSRCKDAYTETVAATGHRYQTQTIYPKCTEQGYVLHTCQTCQNSYKDHYTAPAGHNDTGWGTCRKCDADLSIDMRTRISAPIVDAEHKFYWETKPITNYFYLTWYGKNNSGKTIKYYTLVVDTYNRVGDRIRTTKEKITGPVLPGEIFGIQGNMIGYYHPNRSNSEVAYLVGIQLVYTDGTIEYGTFGKTGYRIPYASE